MPDPRQAGGSGPTGLPRDLQALHELYAHLPPQQVRWRTQPGSAFLDALFSAVEAHKKRRVAAALGTSTQAVDYMLNRPRLSNPRRWPTQEDLRDLRLAWRPVAAAHTARRNIRRVSPQYHPVHTALMVLLEAGFTTGDLALAMGIPTRRLTRFLPEPLPSPQVVARAIEPLLAREPGENPPAWRE